MTICVIKDFPFVRRSWKDIRKVREKAVNQITVTGMVLSSVPIGEYDKRVVILTKERGKISAFAKGARRPNNALMGVTNPFCFGEFLLFEGRNSYNVMQGEISNYFMELSADLEGAYYGFYFLELADYYTREFNDETLMLKLLYQTLRALASKKIDRRLVRYIYELKTLVVNGEYPDPNDEKEFVLPATLYTLQYIIATPIEKLYTFAVSDEVLGELKKVLKKYTNKYIEKRFKSLEILERCLD